MSPPPCLHPCPPVSRRRIRPSIINTCRHFTPSQAAKTSFDDLGIPSPPEVHQSSAVDESEKVEKADDSLSGFGEDSDDSDDSSNLDDSSNYSPGQEEARAAWFYQVCTHHPPTPGGALTWEDYEAQKREWDKEVGEDYMNEMLEDCPNNGPWDI